MVAAILANEKSFARGGVHTFPSASIAGHKVEVQFDFAGLVPSTKTIHRATHSLACRRKHPSGPGSAWRSRVCKLCDRFAGAVINQVPACAGIPASENAFPNNVGIYGSGLGRVRGQGRNVAVGQPLIARQPSASAIVAVEHTRTHDCGIDRFGAARRNRE